MFFKKLKEHRREPRRAMKAMVYYKLDNLWMPWQEAHTVDISEGGACIQARHGLIHEGEMLVLEIPMKVRGKNEILKAIGEVVWKAPYKQQFKYGLAFQKKQVTFSKITSWLEGHYFNFLRNYGNDASSHTAETLEQLKAAYRMVYNEYEPRQICMPHASKMFYNFYSLLPMTRTFLMRKKDRWLGTISLIPDSPAGLPMESLYPDEIRKLRDQGRVMAEVGGLALNSEFFGKKSYSFTDFGKQAYLFKLFKTMFTYAIWAKIDELIIGVHPKHMPLYEFMNFKSMGQVKSYSGASGRPAALMKMDVKTTLRYWHIAQDPLNENLYKDPLPADNFQRHYVWTAPMVKMFLGLRDLATTLKDGQKVYLNACYPALRSHDLKVF